VAWGLSGGVQNGIVVQVVSGFGELLAYGRRLVSDRGADASGKVLADQHLQTRGADALGAGARAFGMGFEISGIVPPPTRPDAPGRQDTLAIEPSRRVHMPPQRWCRIP